jgi:fluoride exporter
MSGHRRFDSAAGVTSSRPPFGDKMGLYAAVIAGSIIGAVLRATVSLVLPVAAGTAFPWATLFVNVTGSFAIGFYAALTGPDGRISAGPRQRAFVMTGICSGYTTFSMFSLETLRLWQTGHPAVAGLNVAVSVATWLAAVWVGHSLALRFNRLKGPKMLQ